MFGQTSMRKLTLVLLSIILFAECKAKRPAETESASPNQPAMEQDAAPGATLGGLHNRKEAADADRMDGTDGRGLGPVALVAPVNAQDRMLEYHVEIVYRTGELLAGRDRLFSIASRRGFLRNSYASAESSSMQLQMAVRSSELYDTLKELDQLGELVTENITVTDHTENNFAQTLKSKREELRTARRGGALVGDAGVRNWTEREAQLQQSEDASDLAQLEKWRISDKVRYATISIRLQGPALPESIQVPVYRNAFTGLLNFFLGFVYYAIYFLPVLFAAALLIRYRRQIKSLLGLGPKQ